jgi:hypothetical protein
VVIIEFIITLFTVLIDIESIYIPAHQRAKASYPKFSVVVVSFYVRSSLGLGGTLIQHFDKIDNPCDVVDKL